MCTKDRAETCIVLPTMTCTRDYTYKYTHTTLLYQLYTTIAVYTAIYSKNSKCILYSIHPCLTHGVLHDRLSSVITDSDAHLNCVQCQSNGHHTTDSGNYKVVMGQIVILLQSIHTCAWTDCTTPEATLTHQYRLS